MAKRQSRPAAPQPRAFVAPTSLSWVDRLTTWVDGLPGPAWGFYLLGGLILVALGWIGQASQGVYLVRPAHVFVSVQPVVALGLIHYFDRSALRAFDRFAPAVRTERVDPREIRWRLTHLPPRGAWMASLVGLLFVPVFAAITPDPARVFQMAPTPVSVAEIHAFMVLIWVTYAPLLVHTIHQLRWVHRIHARYPRVDPYDIGTLYAFSALTARTAVALTLLNYGWTLVYPAPLNNPVNVVLTAFFAVLTAVVFAWPLWGVHRLLAEEKARLLADGARRMKASVAELRRRIDSGRLRAMADLHKAMASLEIEHAALMRIPTWPWPPGTLRGVAAAVLLPIAIWLIQQLLQPLLAR